jgi:hypothetical protein
MEGPFALTLAPQDGSRHVFKAEPAERARIGYVGTRIRCSDLQGLVALRTPPCNHILL